MDWNFIKSIFDPREIIFPFTLRKLFFFLFYALLIAAVVAVETNVGFFDYLVRAVKSNLIPLMAVLYGFEPLLMLVTMAFTKYPDKLPEISEKPPSLQMWKSSLRRKTLRQLLKPIIKRWL